jgi:hypothetical protein
MRVSRSLVIVLCIVIPLVAFGAQHEGKKAKTIDELAQM